MLADASSCLRVGEELPDPAFRRFREIEKRRDKWAHELGIDPTIIASKATIGDLARDWDQYSAELMNWQRDLLQPIAKR